jgi:hypothetical protein
MPIRRTALIGAKSDLRYRNMKVLVDVSDGSTTTFAGGFDAARKRNESLSSCFRWSRVPWSVLPLAAA